jgi:hypothetical protein
MCDKKDSRQNTWVYSRTLSYVSEGTPVGTAISTTCSRIVVSKGQIGWALCFKTFVAGAGIVQFELRTTQLLGRCSTMEVIPSALSSVGYFGDLLP